MAGSHGWAEIDEQRKREIISAIAGATATRGPVHAELDVTDRCNVACYFCNQQDVRTKEQISLEHVRRLIDELVEGGLKSVRLSGGGDPLYHRQIAEIFDSLQSRGVVVDNLTTNGALLGPELARRLVENRCREVLFSLNAADASDYCRMMQVPEATFDRVLENIRGLLAARGDSAFPNIVVQFLIDRKNFSQLPRMYRLGRSLGVDRIAVNPVLEIPLERIDDDLLFEEKADGEALRPYLEEVLREDREAGKLQIFFPFQAWNIMADEIRKQIAEPPREVFATAPSFREINGQCFFGWYTATVRGNGELYPCCMLLNPEYKPLGNALEGTFQSHWRGPKFTKMREEMREVMLRGGRMFYRPGRFETLKRQCVEPSLCGLKNMFFRGDEAFYAELGAEMERLRRREVRWIGTPRQMARAAEVLAFRVYHGVKARLRPLRARLARLRKPRA
ncbi:MAG: radical SAM/SPASM domain-containing protein [Thermoanaerobaculia bacterium]